MHGNGEFEVTVGDKTVSVAVAPDNYSGTFSTNKANRGNLRYLYTVGSFDVAEAGKVPVTVSRKEDGANLPLIEVRFIRQDTL